jgi:hypothetical protein
MTKKSWDQNEIVQAYEKNFTLLEAARKEYGEAVNALLAEIKVSLNELLSTSPLNDALRLNPRELDTDFCRRVIEYQLLAEENIPLLSVLVRLATPWDGSTGCLQIAVTTDLDAKTFHSTEDSLKQMLRTNDTCNGLELGMQKVKLDPKWLHAVELRINADIAAIAARYIASLLQALTPLAQRLDKECSFTASMKGAMEEILHDSKSVSSPSNEWVFDHNLGWWEGMHFLQIKDPKHRNFWVGYHVSKQWLLYGHHQWDDGHGFAKRFFEAAKALKPDFYKGYPAGVIMDKSSLEMRSPEEISKTITDLFRLFYKMAQESSSSAASVGTNH